MNLDLSGKVAFVTGSTAGIGLAIAKGLAEQGAEVWVNGRSQARVDEAIAQIRALYPKAKLAGLAADLGTAEGGRSVAAALPAVDILVNNLGIYGLKPFLEIEDGEWQRFFDVNVMSGVRMTRHFLPAMQRKGWGRIVFISSESAQHIPAEMVHYGMTKTAQLGLARGVAENLVGTDVTVNSVLAGPTRTEAADERIKGQAVGGKTEADVEREFFQVRRPTSLIKRFARPDEVANLVVYLCSPAASATHGAALRAEGGVIRSIL
ncbi:MAG: SDR family oxidoreductase [Pseudomonadota bacterium]